ncbi:MAG: CDP-alcohol phosphatidyltransferase family protein [Anaerolineales bacterium]|nr:CDP-alcohol phosphatidyltransferase family protein [Anaerolineales bacterium]MCK4978387.1 CDP-alcohol phosphatidyltransferase family protein [Anaerolineales bacterium]
MTEQAADRKKKLTLTDQMRVRFKKVLDAIGGFLNGLGLMPNTMTILGLIGNTVGAVFLARGQMTIGGIIILLMGPIDALDGTMARLRGEPSEFGAFVDSVTDRYSELVIFGGLLFYYVQGGEWLPATLTYFAAAGSVMVSYTRARAQSLGYDSKVGILTRFERYIVLAPALVFNIPVVGLWIIAVLANITAIQRIIDVRRQVQK